MTKDFDFNTWLVKSSRFEREELCLGFLEKLEELSGSGLPSGDAIKVMATRIREPRLHGICQRCWKDLREGKSLSQSMRSMNQLFESSVIAILEVGEATGNLSNVLGSARDLMANRIQVRKDFIAGMVYPAMMVVIVILVFLFGLFYIIPKIDMMMSNMGASLSLSVRILLGGAQVSLYALPLVVIGGIASTVSLRRWRQTDEGLYRTDAFLLKIPVYRDILMDSEICRLTNLAAILFRNGVETTEALRLMERSLSNAVLKNKLHQARQMIKEGVPFSRALSKAELLPDMDTDILEVGENTGSLAESFQSIYRNRKTRLTESLQRLTKVIAYGALFLVFSMIFLLVYGIVGSIMQLNNRILGG